MHIIKIWDIKVVLIHSNSSKKMAVQQIKCKHNLWLTCSVFGLKGLNAKCFVQRYFCNRFTAT